LKRKSNQGNNLFGVLGNIEVFLIFFKSA